MSVICINCNLYVSICTSSLLCEKIINNSATHNWIKHTKYNLDNHFECTVCNIGGFKFSYMKQTVINANGDDFWSCNEYLMIKANE